MLKNECFIIKEMSFLKISDPLKRDTIVKEYLELKKNIRDNLLSERIGEQQLQTDLSKFYKPITETQKATARDITEGLKPIREGLKPIREGLETVRKEVHDIPGIVSDMEAVKKYGQEKQKEEEEEDDEEEEKEEEKSPETLGERAYNYLHGKELYDRDKMFGIHLGNDGNYHMGVERGKDGVYRGNNKMITIAYNNIYVDDEKFTGTPGLWELIMEDIPNPENYTKKDLEEYGKLLFKSNAIYQNFEPNNTYPRSNRSYKWKNIISLIWAERTAGKGVERTAGKGVVVIPSDPNALLERLDLLLASQEAGHTGVRNELVSICDELKRQGVLDTKAYKKLNHIIKK